MAGHSNSVDKGKVRFESATSPSDKRISIPLKNVRFYVRKGHETFRHNPLRHTFFFLENCQSKRELCSFRSQFAFLCRVLMVNDHALWATGNTREVPAIPLRELHFSVFGAKTLPRDAISSPVSPHRKAAHSQPGTDFFK
jgi:hypothetical protein